MSGDAFTNNAGTATGASADPKRPAHHRMDWEGFFRRYREPDFVPGYTILNKLGSGVFGEVYKAKKHSIGKIYAIKFLKVHDESITEQVVRELRSIDHFAQVDHPNLVSIEDRGEVAGIPYIVMGYGGDETLKVVLRDAPLAFAPATKLFLQMLAGVQALHERSIIHFDLKPANVFIKGDVARIGDYGLSKLMCESRATLSMGRGTPHYMAPEMLQRRGDARSDVYSLGVILYEMLTGRVPFTGDSEWEILKRHETERPDIPSSLPPGVRAFLATSLEKSPDRRFPTAGAAREAFVAATLGSAPGGADHPRATTDSAPPPDPIADIGRKVGARIGRFAAKGRVTIEKVRGEVQDVLHRVRRETRDAVAGAKEHYRRAAVAARAEPAPVSPPNRRPRFRAVRLGGKAAMGLGRLVVTCVSLPLTIVGLVLSNALAFVAMGALVFAACALVHLGLRAAIL